MATLHKSLLVSSLPVFWTPLSEQCVLCLNEWFLPYNMKYRKVNDMLDKVSTSDFATALCRQKEYTTVTQLPPHLEKQAVLATIRISLLGNCSEWNNLMWAVSETISCEQHAALSLSLTTAHFGHLNPCSRTYHHAVFDHMQYAKWRLKAWYMYTMLGKLIPT